MSENRRSKKKVQVERRKKRYVYYAEIEDVAWELGVPEHKLRQLLDESNIDYEHEKEV